MRLRLLSALLVLIGVFTTVPAQADHLLVDLTATGHLLLPNRCPVTSAATECAGRVALKSIPQAVNPNYYDVCMSYILPNLETLLPSPIPCIISNGEQVSPTWGTSRSRLTSSGCQAWGLRWFDGNSGVYYGYNSNNGALFRLYSFRLNASDYSHNSELGADIWTVNVSFKGFQDSRELWFNGTGTVRSHGNCAAGSQIRNLFFVLQGRYLQG